MMVLSLKHLQETSVHEIVACVSNNNNVSLNMDSSSNLD